GQAVAAAPPDGVETVTPASPEELAGFLAEATRTGTRVAIWGGGTHRDIGYHAPCDVVVSTSGLSGIEEWQPDDLTVVVGRSEEHTSELQSRENLVCRL